MIDPGEECDDGNLLDGDCCSRLCRLEPAGEDGRCDDGETRCGSDADCDTGPCHRLCEPLACDARGPHLKPLYAASTEFYGGDERGEPDSFRSSGVLLEVRDPALAAEDAEVDVRLSAAGAILLAVRLGAVWCPPRSSCAGPPRPGEVRLILPRRPGNSPVPVGSCAAPLCSAAGWRRPGRAPLTWRLRGGPPGARRAADFALAVGGEADLADRIGVRLRETLRIGDDCYTSVLRCRRVPDDPDDVRCESLPLATLRP